MEGYPPTDALVSPLVERTGLPREAFRTFAEHGELDPATATTSTARWTRSS